MALAIALDAPGAEQAAHPAQKPGYQHPTMRPARRVLVLNDLVDEGPNGRGLVAVGFDSSEQLPVVAVHYDGGPDRLRRGCWWWRRCRREDNQAHALTTLLRPPPQPWSM
jgi:hypothetical protein